jgi:hypothetical protein
MHTFFWFVEKTTMGANASRDRELEQQLDSCRRRYNELRNSKPRTQRTHLDAATTRPPDAPAGVARGVQRPASPNLAHRRQRMKTLRDKAQAFDVYMKLPDVPSK